MRPLIFHGVPEAPYPLYLGEPDDMVREVAHVICDHPFGAVYPRPLNPYSNYDPLEHEAQRFTALEIPAMTPFRQVVDRIREAKPWIEQGYLGTIVLRTEDGWARSSTPEADAAFAVAADIMVQAPVDPVEWVPSLQALTATADQRMKAAKARPVLIVDKAPIASRGLALSGGGIRSAQFAFGALQALKGRELLLTPGNHDRFTSGKRELSLGMTIKRILRG